MCNDIAVLPSGNMVVIEGIGKGHTADLFDSSGKYITPLTSPDEPESKLNRPSATAVTSEGQIVVVDRSQYVKMFDGSGVYLQSFCLPEGATMYSKSVATTKHHIVVGESTTGMITIHDHGGFVLTSFKASVKPNHLAVNSKQRILICQSGIGTHLASSKPKAKVLSLTGEDILTIGSFTLRDHGFVLDISETQLYGITSDRDDNMYIVVRPDPKLCSAKTNRGHIHKYDKNGNFVACILSGLYMPKGIAWSNDSLYVADNRNVKIFSNVYM